MDCKPFSLEGFIYTPLSNTGEILDNLSPITAWPSYNGTRRFLAPSHQHQEHEQHLDASSGFMAGQDDDQAALALDTIYTSQSPSPVLDTTAYAAATFSNFDNLSADSFHDLDSSKINDINNHSQINFNSLFDPSDAYNNNDTERNNETDMSLLTTTYITKSAALNLNNLTPFSIHPQLTMSRSSSITSAVSFIDPLLLSQNNNNNSNSNSNTNSCGASASAFSTPLTRRLSTFSNGSFESEDESYATMHTMFENNLRMSPPAFGSYSSERFESQSPLSTFTTITAAVTPETTPAPELTFLVPPAVSQDIQLADGSILRFDGSSFRPTTATTSAMTATLMNNAHLASGMVTMPIYRPSVIVDPTLTSPPIMMVDTHQQLTTVASCANTAAYYNDVNMAPPLPRHQKLQSINDSFKTYDKSPYHRHLPLKSVDTTTDSTSFASALLSPYPAARRGSADSTLSTATSSSNRSRLVMGSHSRHSSTASFKDFDEHIIKRAPSSSSLLSSSSPSVPSSSTFTSESAESRPCSSTSTKYRKDKSGEFQCPYVGCDYRYNLKREFNRHRNVHVFAGKDKYRCMNCSSGLCRLDSVKRHMEAKGKADCLKKGLYEEFHESGQYSLIRKCKQSWYEAAAAARAVSAAKKKV
ncbi:hypothetical protein BGZ95_000534 [Linnemannia exigua]|uniref:C2H2-type domain-containing protein n=1 Tax=Linnemannia exigua TaxID=604196 RepID=A0AAD4DM16_9FUNG|nr:hypothetical protein BGZ95_000534 [Linnemannia exigua]